MAAFSVPKKSYEKNRFAEFPLLRNGKEAKSVISGDLRVGSDPAHARKCANSEGRSARTCVLPFFLCRKSPAKRVFRQSQTGQYQTGMAGFLSPGGASCNLHFVAARSMLWYDTFIISFILTLSETAA